VKTLSRKNLNRKILIKETLDRRNFKGEYFKYGTLLDREKKTLYRRSLNREALNRKTLDMET